MKSIHIVPLADVQDIFDSTDEAYRTSPAARYIYIHNNKDHPVKLGVKGMLLKQWRQVPSGSVWSYYTVGKLEVYFEEDGRHFTVNCEAGRYTMTDFDGMDEF